MPAPELPYWPGQTGAMVRPFHGWDARIDPRVPRIAPSVSTGDRVTMFTGIVEDTGTIEVVAPGDPGQRITVRSALDWSTTALGDSVSVDGVCLTVVVIDGPRVAFDLGPETLAVTTLNGIAIGRRVHLERALRLGDRLGGHLVSGHVDGIGTVRAARRDGDALFVQLDAPPAVLRLCVPKGSICIDGTSLTINVVDDRGFEVCLIPHTLARTHLATLQAGDRVNLEADMIAKMVERLVQPHLPLQDRIRASTPEA